MKTKKQKGFTLLVAIVTTTLLFIVSFAIVDLALKLLVLAYSSQESQYAFYNAETGVECAIYWDLKNTTGISAFDVDTPSTISCNNQTIQTGDSLPTPPGGSALVGGGGAGNPQSVFVINNLQPKGCVVVFVTKYVAPSAYETKIDSYGYNSCSSGAIRRFERGVTITY